MVLEKNIDCYKLLELDKDTANPSSIKKAYRQLALKFHPDKQPQNATDEQIQEANESFQRLGIAYSVLNDPKRKERYDRTGSMDETEFEGDKDWNAYFKELWTGVVTAETIEAQKLKYQGSEEEKADVIEAYKTCKGDMNKILEVVECSAAVDGERFEKIIREAIDSNTLTLYKVFTLSTTPKAHEMRINKEKKDAVKFEKDQEKKSKKKQKEDKSGPSLEALIMQRAKERHSSMNSIIESLESEARGEKRKKNKPEAELPSEEEFLKLQESLFKKKKNKSK